MGNPIYQHRIGIDVRLLQLRFQGFTTSLTEPRGQLLLELFEVTRNERLVFAALHQADEPIQSGGILPGYWRRTVAGDRKR